MAKRVVVDATADVLWGLTEQDSSCATPLDPCNCAVAQAVKRVLGHDAAVEIHLSVAYIRMPCDQKTAQADFNKGRGAKQGELAWHRFRLDPVLGEEIKVFDATGKPISSGIHRFRAPTPSQTLAAKAARSHAVVAPGSRGPIQPSNLWLRDPTVRLES